MDFKKGGEIVSYLVNDGFKIDHAAAKKAHNSNIAQWKASGLNKKFVDWAKDNREVVKSKCVIL